MPEMGRRALSMDIQIPTAHFRHLFLFVEFLVTSRQPSLARLVLIRVQVSVLMEQAALCLQILEKISATQSMV